MLRGIAQYVACVAFPLDRRGVQDLADHQIVVALRRDALPDRSGRPRGRSLPGSTASGQQKEIEQQQEGLDSHWAYDPFSESKMPQIRYPALVLLRIGEVSATSCPLALSIILSKFRAVEGWHRNCPPVTLCQADSVGGPAHVGKLDGVVS